MRYTLQIIFLIFSFYGFSQQIKKPEELKYAIINDSFYSTNLQDDRAIKIYLPEGYDVNEKYPVIYVLDADWIFMPTMAETTILSEFDVIPKSIVVGVLSQIKSTTLWLPEPEMRLQGWNRE